MDKVAGLLGQDQRAWLEQFLKEADDRPIVFFVHHTLGEGDGDLLDTDRFFQILKPCLLYTSPSPRDATLSRMPSSA